MVTDGNKMVILPFVFVYCTLLSMFAQFFPYRDSHREIFGKKI
jgi:hypothetical protein